jgi:hypothetical protein
MTEEQTVLAVMPRCEGSWVQMQDGEEKYLQITHVGYDERLKKVIIGTKDGDLGFVIWSKSYKDLKEIFGDKPSNWLGGKFKVRAKKNGKYIDYEVI